jgi:hypothetical protein
MDSSAKPRLSSATPAGFGALAITVSPPPATAPATSMYFDSSEMPLMSEPRYVSAALSVMAVRPSAPKKSASGSRPATSGCSHQRLQAPSTTSPARKNATSRASRMISVSWWRS